MTLATLRAAVESHTGTFLCERINHPGQTKVAHFRHVVGQPEAGADVPAVGCLREFVETFGSVVFFQHDATGEAAKHLAPPSQWTELHSDFSDWIDQLDEDERAEILPDWIDHCLVIGEEPRTGNYLLMPVDGPDAGAVYLFDHDGFEFTREAADVAAFIERMLAPDDMTLTGIASHMRFIEGDPMVQWWILDLTDNRGNTATTRA